MTQEPLINIMGYIVLVLILIMLVFWVSNKMSKIGDKIYLKIFGGKK